MVKIEADITICHGHSNQHQIEFEEKGMNYICSRCKKEFKTEEEYEFHSENYHNNLKNDDKDALRKTSELSALLANISNLIPDIMDTAEKPEETKEIKEDTNKPSLQKEDAMQIEKRESISTKSQDPSPIEIDFGDMKQSDKKNDKIFECDQCPFISDSTRNIGMHKKS